MLGAPSDPSKVQHSDVSPEAFLDFPRVESLEGEDVVDAELFLGVEVPGVDFAAEFSNLVKL